MPSRSGYSSASPSAGQMIDTSPEALGGGFVWATPQTRSTGQLLLAAACLPWESCAGRSSGRQCGGPQWVIASPGLQGKWSDHDPLMSLGAQAPPAHRSGALLQVTATPCSSLPTPPWAPLWTLISWIPVSSWGTQPRGALRYLVPLYRRHCCSWHRKGRQSAEQDEGPGPPASP